MYSKQFLFLLGFFITSGNPFAQSSISVQFSNLRNNNGNLLVSLFNNDQGYPEEANKAYRTARINISNKMAGVIFADIVDGEYAIAILHDENGDGKMNTNFFGLPKEGYGFSNNVMRMFGPPSFREASFTTSGVNKMVTIKVKY